MIEIGECEYCQRKNMVITSTPELGCYCKDCHALVRDNCKTAIADIRKYEKMQRQRRKSHE